MLLDRKVSVVLPAAGTGERTGLGIPKQYVECDGKAIYLHTIDTFLEIKWIDEIILVVSEEYLSTVKLDLNLILPPDDAVRIKVVVGDKFRHKSIFNGVKHVDSGADDIVVIHDVVRVFVNETLLRNVVTHAMQYGACGVTRPLVSTVVVKSESGFLERSLDRSKCRSSEMPQAFRHSVIDIAYRMASPEVMQYGTECLQLVVDYFVEDEAAIAGKVTSSKAMRGDWVSGGGEEGGGVSGGGGGVMSETVPLTTSEHGLDCSEVASTSSNNDCSTSPELHNHNRTDANDGNGIIGDGVGGDGVSGDGVSGDDSGVSGDNSGVIGGDGCIDDEDCGEFVLVTQHGAASHLDHHPTSSTTTTTFSSTNTTTTTTTTTTTAVDEKGSIYGQQWTIDKLTSSQGPFGGNCTFTARSYGGGRGVGVSRVGAGAGRRAGVRVKLLDGDSSLWKVTHADDIDLLRRKLQERSSEFKEN